MHWDPTQRFSDRVDNYVRYRPRYPSGVIPLLEEEIGLTKDSNIADVGSGTGFSSEPFLAHGNRVFAVEPNEAMRLAAEARFARNPLFHSISGSAESTTLSGGSIDVVVVGQAFHWFDVAKTKHEFARLLKPDGWIVLMWNTRRTGTSAFLTAYESLLLRFGTDYQKVNHANISNESLDEFFAPGRCNKRTLFNEQVFDYDGLEGRLLSSSYAPTEGNAQFQPMLQELRAIFDRHNSDGKVRFEYDTEVYFARMIHEE